MGCTNRDSSTLDLYIRTSAEPRLSQAGKLGSQRLKNDPPNYPSHHFPKNAFCINWPFVQACLVVSVYCRVGQSLIQSADCQLFEVIFCGAKIQSLSLSGFHVKFAQTIKDYCKDKVFKNSLNTYCQNLQKPCCSCLNLVIEI